MQANAREAGLPPASIYPMCANDCGRRARARIPGSLCKPCRAAAGDPAVLCLTEGCGGVRYTRGVCSACLSGGKAAKPPRPAAQARGLKCELDGCANKPARFGPARFGSVCEKHRENPNACTTRGCARDRVEAGKCDKHRPGEQGTCEVYLCQSSRFKARLCYSHFKRRNPTLCAHGDCANTTTAVYCRVHDVGIDFASGDWFDWVAVDQLWWGRLDPTRKPTVPELTALFDRAERSGIGATVLSRQVGINEDRLKSWREILGRVQHKTVEVAA